MVDVTLRQLYRIRVRYSALVRGFEVWNNYQGRLSWLRTVAPNIHPNVDGEVAYAAPINGLAVGYIQV